jgi:hypothetical protein
MVLSKIEFVKERNLKVAKLKQIRLGTSPIIADIISRAPQAPGIKSADELLKQINKDSFRKRCFTKASGLKKRNKQWKGK